jgi:hypothetical protein
MFSGIVMLVLGLLLAVWSILRFRMGKRYDGILYMLLALISLTGGIILLVITYTNQ